MLRDKGPYIFHAIYASGSAERKRERKRAERREIVQREKGKHGETDEERRRDGCVERHLSMRGRCGIERARERRSIAPYYNK